jgi:hypothetical protein
MKNAIAGLTQALDSAGKRSLKTGVKINTLGLRIIVGWVEGRETQQTTENVGFRSSNATCYKSA